MSFDISRITFDPRNNFSAVVMQQGRVQLDSDWNEWLGEFARRIRAGTLDTLGRAAVPLTTKSAFKISLAKSPLGDVSIGIGPGRIYVDGLLAENHGLPAPNPQKWIPGGGAVPLGAAPSLNPVLKLEFSPFWDSVLDEVEGKLGVNYQHQPYYPNVDLVAPFPQSGGPYLIYLDVWQREVTLLEDPDLVEKAVGVDTTGRLQTVWQVKWLDVSTVPGVDCSTQDANLPAAWQNLLLPPGPRLTTGVVQSSPSGPCCLTPNTGYTGRENQLYRVEIHQPGNLTSSGLTSPPGSTQTATFKWSRDNASVVTAVTAITQAGTVLTVQSTGKDGVLRFSPDDWVEITDDWLELNGLPGELHQVSGVDDVAKTITFSSAVSATGFPVDATGLTDPSRHTRLTRWDQGGTVFQSDGVTVWTNLDLPGSTGDILVPPAGTALILENGVTISFDLKLNARPFKTGDSWAFAARAADGTVEYLEETPPRGIHHHYARLAVMSMSSAALSGTGTLTLHDNSQPPVTFLTFQATNTNAWPANFAVATRANAVNPANFDLEVLYRPAVSQGVNLPVTVESFTNLSLDPGASNYAPRVINGSNFVSVPASFSPPSKTPIFPSNFSAGTPLPASGTFQLTDTSSPPIPFLTLQIIPPANWPPNFAVSASPSGTAGNFNLEVVYASSARNTFATLERFENLSPTTGASQVNSQFITNLASPLSAPFSALNLITFADCRTFWPPASMQAKGIHVLDVRLITPSAELLNDSNIQVAQLPEGGLGIRVICDAPIDPVSAQPTTCYLTVDLPYTQDVLSAVGSANAGTVGASGFHPLILPGQVAVAGSEIDLFVKPITVRFLLGFLDSGLTSSLLAHLTLKGSFIWGKDDPTMYLDGKAFGIARTDPAGPRIGLRLPPSGNGTAGSDFEMWFWLVRPVSVTSVTFSPNPVNVGQPSFGTVTLNGFPPRGGAVVTLSSNDPTLGTIAPSAVTIQDGQLSGLITVTNTSVPAGAQTAALQVTASYAGSSAEGTLTINKPLTLTALSFSPTSVTAGSPSSGTVTLSGPAPAPGGAQIALSGNQPATVASVPASVTVPAGQSGANFTVTTTQFTQTQRPAVTLQVTGSFAGVSVQGTLTINPQFIG